MNVPEVTSWLSYKSVRKLVSTHGIRHTEVPTEYYISLPLPTVRAGKPAFACFASAFFREIPADENQTVTPVHYSAPDRWWLFSARGEYLLQYNLCELLPFSGLPFQAYTVIDFKSLIDLQKQLKVIDTSFEVILPGFFDNVEVTADEKDRLRNALHQFIPQEQLPIYTALVPDFFQWLNS